MAYKHGDKRIPWGQLPKVHVIEVFDWDLGSSARCWIVGGMADKKFDEFQRGAVRALRGHAHGGSTGFGAWDEGEPWCQYVSSATLSMQTLSRSKGLEDAKHDYAHLGVRWAQAMDDLEIFLRRELPDGDWFLDQGFGSHGNPPLLAGKQGSQIGAKILAIRESMEMRSLVASSPRGSKPSL